MVGGAVTIVVPAAVLVLKAAWKPPARRVKISTVHVENETRATEAQLAAFAPLQKYVQNLKSGLLSDTKIELQSITALYAYMFGEKVGFLLLDVAITTKDANDRVMRMPGGVLLRGPSVAILIWQVDSQDVLWVMLVKQPRVCTGDYVHEMPAGMLADNSFLGTAFNELKTEAGLDVNNADLQKLSTVPMYTSPGLLDEGTVVYALHRDDLRDHAATVVVEDLGETEENEIISDVVAVPHDHKLAQRDMKLQAAIKMAASNNIFPAKVLCRH